MVTAILATPLLTITALQGGEKAPELEGSDKAFSEAWSTGGAEALGAQYTEDALMFPPNAPVVKGSKAIVEFFEAGKAPGATLWLKDAESSVTGDTAFKWGHYKVKGLQTEPWSTKGATWRPARKSTATG